VVEAVGRDAGDWRRGEPVAIQSNLYCGQCEFCLRGRESLCLEGELLGVQRDGGFATRVVVPGRSLVRLPPGVDFTTSAALTLAGSTAMHMLTRRARVNSGDWVLVMGAASGVGSAAIQIAKQLGGRVITTASTEPKRQLGLRLGAEHLVDLASENWPAEVRRLTGKHGADLIVEHLGGTILQKAFNCLARGGTIVTCGATTGREVGFNLWPVFVKEQQLVGSYGRDRADMEEALTWAAAGRLQPVIDRVLPLERGAEGFAALRAREVLGKVIIGGG
jgi:NADPH:quinone reductase-like Zn-dependent oxidoreductase